MSNDLELNTETSTPALGSDMPQFETAEYAHVPGTERCRICGAFIAGEYYRVNNQMACSQCAVQAQAGQPKDSHAAFLRGLLLGVGAAAIGCALYSTIVIVTGFTIGYLALGVGWLVAKAIMKGSNGMGGTRYQIAAVLLTYAAISMAEIPIAIAFSIKEHSAHVQQSQSATQTDNDSSASSASSNGGQQSSQPREHMGLGKAAATLFFIGIASPFLELASPGHGLIGLVILFVGLSIAFRMTKARPLAVDGPYSVAG